MALTKLEEGAAVGIVGLAVVQSLSMYREAAPSIDDLRRAPAGDLTMRQHILDADVYGAIVVLLVTGSASVLTRRAFPLVIGSTALIAISYYHRSVLNSPSPYRGTSNQEGE